MRLFYPMPTIPGAQAPSSLVMRLLFSRIRAIVLVNHVQARRRKLNTFSSAPLTFSPTSLCAPTCPSTIKKIFWPTPAINRWRNSRNIYAATFAIYPHETEMIKRIEDRQHVEGEARLGYLDDWGPPLRGLSPVCMMIRTNTGFVVEEDQSMISLGASSNLRELLLAPPLYQDRILLPRSVQRALRCETQTSQKAADRAFTQKDIEFPLDLLTHHLDDPESELKLQLKGVLRAHEARELGDLPIGQLWRRPGNRLRPQHLSPVGKVSPNPTVDRPPVDAEFLVTALSFPHP